MFQPLEQDYLLNVSDLTCFLPDIPSRLTLTVNKRAFFEPLWEQKLVLCAVMNSRIQV